MQDILSFNNMGGFLAHLWWAVVIKVSALKTYVVDFLRVFKSTIFTFLALYTKKKRYG